MAEFLREYLIKLGFKTDEHQWSNFTKRVGTAAQNVNELGAAAITSATLVGTAIKQVSDHFTALYYVSQRVGLSTGYLTSYGFAAKQIGISSEAAIGQINAMGIAIRANPALSALGRMFTGGRAITPINIVQGLSHLPDFLAFQFAAQFGISPEQYLQMKDNMSELLDYQRRYNEKLRDAGLTTAEMNKTWLATTRALNDAGINFTIVGDTIARDLVKTGVIRSFARAVDAATRWFIRVDRETGGGLGVLSGAAGLVGGELTLEAIWRLATGKRGPLAALLTSKKGLAGVAVGMAGAIKADAERDNQMRSFLRSLLGIEDPHEPAPWLPGGAFHQTPPASAIPPRLPSPDLRPRSFNERFGVEFPGGGAQLNKFFGTNPNYFNARVPAPGPQASITQNVHIEVNGAGDPHAVADAVQRKVGALGRDLSVALRQAGMVPVVT